MVTENRITGLAIAIGAAWIFAVLAVPGLFGTLVDAALALTGKAG